MLQSIDFQPGLEGVIAADTRLSRVDGERGELIIAGFPLAALAPRATFEETVYLLWHDSLPTRTQLNAFRHDLQKARPLPAATLDLLAAAAAAQLPPMDALRMAVSTVSLPAAAAAFEDNHEPAVALVARVPVIVAAYWRLLQGLDPIAPHEQLPHAANFLYMLTGDVPHPERSRGLDTYLNTVVDHGLNASTFAARVIIATGSDLVSAVTGAVGALKGPLHGGAPGPALDMVFEIGDVANIEPVLRRRLAAGERLMGFGHRIYRVRDPRADVLGAAAEQMYRAAGDMSLYTLAKAVEERAVALLAEHKPGRNLKTNVEFYTALLLHGLDLPTALFTPTFAMSRVAGWIAHCFEQQELHRIIRPQSIYHGPHDRQWVPLEARQEAGVLG